MKAFHLAGCHKMVGPADKGCLTFCPERLVAERDEAVRLLRVGHSPDHQRHPRFDCSACTFLARHPEDQ